MTVLLALLFYPGYWYEVLVRSEIISNMILLIGVLWLAERTPSTSRNSALVFLGVLLGIVVSTRAVVVLPLIIYSRLFLVRHGMKRTMIVLLIAAIAFTGLLLPLYVWMPGDFMAYNPLLKQSSFIPMWLLAVVVMIAIALAIRTQTLDAFYRYSGAVLFATVCVAFVLSCVRIGWYESIFDHGFDLAYFTIPIPFLVIGLYERTAGKERVA